MEEKERYDLQEVFEYGSFYWCLKDNDTKLLKPLVNLYDCVDLLNQQDKEIKKIKKELSKYKSYKTIDERIRDLENLYSDYKKENLQLKQSQKQLAIEVLEKFKSELVNKTSPIQLSYTDYVKQVYDKINNQIKELKGEK